MIPTEDNSEKGEPKEEKELNWLERGMRETHGYDEKPDKNGGGVIAKPKTFVRDDWLEVLINRAGGGVWNLLKSTFSNIGKSSGPRPGPVTDDDVKGIIGQKHILGISLDDPMLEARSLLMFIVLNLGVMGIIFGGGVMAYLQQIFVWSGIAYVLYRVILLRRFTVKTVFDNSRCGKCLENMKKIYGFVERRAR